MAAQASLVSVLPQLVAKPRSIGVDPVATKTGPDVIRVRSHTQGDDTAITDQTHTYHFRIATRTPIARELTDSALADHPRLWQPGAPYRHQGHGSNPPASRFAASGGPVPHWSTGHESRPWGLDRDLSDTFLFASPADDSPVGFLNILRITDACTDALTAQHLQEQEPCEPRLLLEP